MIGPLGQLKKATQNIKDGNLDFTVEPCGVAEINDLCEDFEEMRISDWSSDVCSSDLLYILLTRF